MPKRIEKRNFILPEGYDHNNSKEKKGRIQYITKK